MPEHLYRELGRCDLVIVKGDMNYRRLLDDCAWPLTTPFEEIVCYAPAPLAALRTLKSELAVGLTEGRQRALQRLDADWLTSGRRG